MALAAKLKNKIRHFLVKRFDHWEKKWDLHVVPANFNSPIPIQSEFSPEVFDKIFTCTGVDWNEAEQLHLLERMATEFQNEYSPEKNSGLSLMDAFVLYVMVRIKKPAVMIEVGSGESTKVTLKALKANKDDGHHCKFYAIEPYPQDYLKQLDDPDFQLIVKPLQQVELEFLVSADLFFVDSTHISKVDSDVNYEILEIVPKLKKDALIHFHDIVMPRNYWQEWVTGSKLFWNESYMLHAFLAFNDSFKITWAAQYMQTYHHEKIEKSFPFFDNQKHKLSSFWIQRVK